MARIFWGIGLMLLGFWLGVVRALGGFGNATLANGATLIVLIVFGLGIYLTATAVARTEREFDRTDHEEIEDSGE